MALALRNRKGFLRPAARYLNHDTEVVAYYGAFIFQPACAYIMDPVSVASLVAACASLATNCVKAAEALRSLVDRYKQAELSILSLVEECATIQLAWRGIEKWAEKNIQQMDSHEEIAERLARSVYAGQLIMSALQEDIGNLAPKTGGFRRRASLSWSDDLIREHQNRIRGQTNALQLLLQVISM